MTTTPEIPEAAVEAGAHAVYDATPKPDDVGWGNEPEDFKDEVRRSARVVLAAAWPHLHPTITTAEELDALPMGSVVRDSTEVVFEQWSRSSDRWVSVKEREDAMEEAVILPATVLYRGDAQ